MTTFRYGEHELEEDIDMFMKEVCDLSIYTIVDKIKETEENSDNQVVYEAVNDHLKNARFLQFAADFIEAERRFLANDDWEIVDSNIESKEFNDSDASSENKVISVPSSVNSVVKAKASKADMKQLRKDIERDQLLVNSKHVIGASVLLEGAIEAIAEVAQQILLESAVPLLPPIVSDHLAHAILFKASRTHSGGLVFSTLQGLIDQERLILVPQSSMSPPIRIHISLGMFPSDYGNSSHTGSHPWGLICKISSESFYLVNKMDDMMGISEDSEKLTQEDAPSDSFEGHRYAGKLLSTTYEDFIYFDIKYYGNEMSNIDRIVADTTFGPVVKIRPVTSSSSSF